MTGDIIRQWSKLYSSRYKKKTSALLKDNYSLPGVKLLATVKNYYVSTKSSWTLYCRKLEYFRGKAVGAGQGAFMMYDGKLLPIIRSNGVETLLTGAGENKSVYGWDALMLKFIA